MCEYDSASSKFSSASKVMAKPVPYFISAMNVFGSLGKFFKPSLLLELPTTYVSEQDFSQAPHMRNKYRKHLDMNRTDGYAIPLKLITLQSALKKLTDKEPGARLAVVGIRVSESEVKCPTHSFEKCLTPRF